MNRITEFAEKLEIHKSLISMIKVIRAKYGSEGWFQQELDIRLREIEMGRSAWLFDLVETPLLDVDRRKSMLAGPFFTSEEYPWPVADGKHNIPIVQIDLRDLSNLSGEGVGDGLLQLWILGDSDVGDIRVIPRDMVDSSDLTNDIPTTATMNLDWGCFAECLNGEGDAVYVIRGFSGPVFSMYSSLESFDDKSADGIAELSTVMELATKIKGELGGHHAFGSFSPVQYSPGECENVLIALDSDLPFFWGDSGNAQIFYTLKESGDPVFSFRWSCY
jgi:hypothetical protein